MELPLRIGPEIYVTLIGGFSDELDRGIDPYFKVYIGVGINQKYLKECGIPPYENCLVYPLGGSPRSLIYKLKYFSFEIIPLDDAFPESLELSKNGELILPTRFEDKEGFREGKEIIINLTPFRRL